MSDRRVKVFVYGTLKRGYQNQAYYLPERDPNIIFIGEAETIKKFGLFDLGPYPCVINDDKAQSVVKGEVFEINEDILKDLDYLEGYPDLYDRTKIEVVLTSHPSQPVVTAWIYLMRTTRKNLLGAAWKVTELVNGEWNREHRIVPDEFYEDDDSFAEEE